MRNACIDDLKGKAVVFVLVVVLVSDRDCYIHPKDIITILLFASVVVVFAVVVGNKQ